MLVVVAPDKFKGSLSAAEAAEAIGRGLRAAGADIDLAPIADGERARWTLSSWRREAV